VYRRRMKEIQTTMFEAVDGETFTTLKACSEHEIALLDQLLASVAPDDIRAALKRVRGMTVRADRGVTRPAALKDAAE
jgi:hypothetical protein